MGCLGQDRGCAASLASLNHPSAILPIFTDPHSGHFRRLGDACCADDPERSVPRCLALIAPLTELHVAHVTFPVSVHAKTSEVISFKTLSRTSELS
jgi:hypothetical protein